MVVTEYNYQHKTLLFNEVFEWNFLSRPHNSTLRSRNQAYYESTQLRVTMVFFRRPIELNFSLVCYFVHILLKYTSEKTGL